jgi:MFS family permease
VGRGARANSGEGSQENIAESATSPRLLGVLKNLRESLGLLWTRRFGTFWFSSLLSNIGTWTQQVAEPWLLLTLGASSFLIGLDSFAMNAPVLALTLVGGMLADRADRRSVIAWFQGIQMLCPTAIAVLLVCGTIRPWMVIALSVVVGITDALSLPSFQSIVPSIVARDQIGRGLALNSTQFNLSRILGPSIAGVLMSSAGAMACFVVSAASYVPFIGVALWILPRRPPAAPSAQAAPRLESYSGFGVVLRQPYLRGALVTVFATALLCTPLITFVPVLVKEGFQGDAGQFSLAVAAFGAGGLLGAAILLSLATTIDRRRLCAGSALAYGGVLVLIAYFPWFWGIPVLLTIAGALMTMCGTSANSLLQSTVGSQTLGKAVSLYMLAMRGGLALGSLLTGLAVDLVGVRNAILIDGAVAMAVLAALMVAWLRAPLPAVPPASPPL